MTKSVDSTCENSIYESITYICDKCGKELTIYSTDELEIIEEVFDFSEPYNDELLCLKCSKQIKDKNEIM